MAEALERLALGGILRRTGPFEASKGVGEAWARVREQEAIRGWVGRGLGTWLMCVSLIILYGLERRDSKSEDSNMQ